MLSLKKRVASVEFKNVTREWRVRKGEWQLSCSKRRVSRSERRVSSIDFDKVSAECRVRKNEWHVSSLKRRVSSSKKLGSSGE